MIIWIALDLEVVRDEKYGMYLKSIILVIFQSDTLLLANVYENFRNINLVLHILSVPGLVWQACLKE